MSVAYSNLILASSPLLSYNLGEASGTFADSGSAGLTANPAGTGLVYLAADPWGGTEAVTLATTNYIEVPDAAALDTPTTAITVECLGKWNDNQNSTIMVGRWSGLGGTLSWYMATENTYTGRPMFNCYLNSSQKVVHDSLSTLTNDGKWHHFAGTYDGSFVRLYVDGIDVGNPASASGSLLASTLPVRMGMLSDTPGWNFAGGLSHVAVYSTALSASVIAAHAIEALGRPQDIAKVKTFAQLHNRYFL